MGMGESCCEKLFSPSRGPSHPVVAVTRLAMVDLVCDYTPQIEECGANPLSLLAR